MNESLLTFQGWVGNEVAVREVGDASVATFRVGSTPRRYNRAANGWADGETTWYTVNAWRALARNCAESLRRGDPVTVQGRLTTQVWKDEDGKDQVTWVVEAVAVGHDLNRGTSVFLRTAPARDRDEGDDSELRRLNAELGTTGPQLSSDGPTMDKEPAA
jgi:single-strand DNA-binding protein